MGSRSIKHHEGLIYGIDIYQKLNLRIGHTEHRFLNPNLKELIENANRTNYNSSLSLVTSKIFEIPDLNGFGTKSLMTFIGYPIRMFNKDKHFFGTAQYNREDLEKTFLEKENLIKDLRRIGLKNENSYYNSLEQGLKIIQLDFISDMLKDPARYFNFSKNYNEFFR